MSKTPWQDLIEVVAKLRSKDGCPWDKEQTHESLTKYAIEEAYELEDAIESGYTKDVVSELGDVLLQVVLHSQIASEEKTFTVNDVITNISEKMIRRHPHVFADTEVTGTDDVMKNWEQIKREEKKSQGKDPRKIFDIPKNLPALTYSEKIGKKTNLWGFDWQDAEGVLAKVNEELDELTQAIRSNDHENSREELGDLLFSLAQLGRHLNIDANKSLRQANNKFETRFNKMLTECSGLEKFTELSSEQKEQLWHIAKLAD